jgi:2-dehydropantoate 2-reductase
MGSDQKSIFIVGAGAIGKVLAVFLKLSGRNVTMIRGSVNDGSKKTKSIRVETANGTIHEADIDIFTLSTFHSIDGIVVLANKSYGNEQLATMLKDKIGSSPLVLLQNGLGVEQPFIQNDFPEVYRCVLFVTSQSVDEMSVRFKPVALCPIGIEKGNMENLNIIVQQLHTPDFGFKSEPHIQQIIWKKAIVNSVFNSVCPLLEVDNGIFHRNKTAFQIARQVISECTAIAREKGILIDTKEVEESLLQISKASDGQLISTLQDIRNKRRTEIETLNFEIVNIAGSLNKGHSVEMTKLLGELTMLKADLNQQVGL